MKGTIFAAGVVTVGILMLAGGANAGGMKEGKWSMTTVIKMDGTDNEMTKAQKEMENMSPEDKAMMESMMGGMGMKMGVQGGGMSTTITKCLTNDNPVPETENQKNCKETHSVRGNTVHFETTCTNSHSTGEVTYKNDTMKGLIKSTQIEKGKETTSTIDISGQYVGPCDQANTTLNLNHPSAKGLSDKEFTLKEKELNLKKQELELKQKELDNQAAAKNGAGSSNGKSALNDANNAASTANNVKNIFGGVKSLFGR